MSLTDAERFLLDWHARRPGETARAMSEARDDQGQSSYDRLVALVRPGDQVLDLCCGDGFLLEGILAAGAAQAWGLDASEAELGGARARLGPERLHLGRAQALPYDDGAFDLVTCHLALMLLDPVDPVLSEVRRVLRPGGRFAFVVGGPGVEGDVWSRLVDAFLALPRRTLRLGDARSRSEAGLRALMAGFEQVRIEPFVVTVPGDRATIWAQFQSTYNPDLSNPDTMADLERRFLEEIAPDPLALLTAHQGRRLGFGIRP